MFRIPRLFGATGFESVLFFPAGLSLGGAFKGEV